MMTSPESLADFEKTYIKLYKLLSSKVALLKHNVQIYTESYSPYSSVLCTFNYYNNDIICFVHKHTYINGSKTKIRFHQHKIRNIELLKKIYCTAPPKTDYYGDSFIYHEFQNIQDAIKEVNKYLKDNKTSLAFDDDLNKILK